MHIDWSTGAVSGFGFENKHGQRNAGIIYLYYDGISKWFFGSSGQDASNYAETDVTAAVSAIITDAVTDHTFTIIWSASSVILKIDGSTIVTVSDVAKIPSAASFFMEIAITESLYGVSPVESAGVYLLQNSLQQLA